MSSRADAPGREAGGRLVALAERSPTSSRRARPTTTASATYPFASIDALRKRAATSRAPVPPSIGGLGVASVHDVVVASSRLARGDASVAIGVNMHIGRAAQHRAPLGRWRWRRRTPAGRARSRARCRRSARRRRVIADRRQRARPGPHAPGARPRPAPATAGGSTAARCSARCRRPRPCSTPRSRSSTTTARALRLRAGARPTRRASTIHDDWDALGMRASGSHSVTLRRASSCPRRAARRLRRPATRTPTWSATSPPGCSTRRRRSASPRRALRHGRRRGRNAGRRRSARMLLAENAIDLGAARAALARAATLVDDHYAANPATDGGADELTALFAEAQAAKTFINEAAARIVDRALALVRRRRLPQRPPARPRVPRRPRRRASCTRSAPTAPTTCSPTSRSAGSPRCTEARVMGPLA